jgi:hypothetical protein
MGGILNLVEGVASFAILILGCAGILVGLLGLYVCAVKIVVRAIRQTKGK